MSSTDASSDETAADGGALEILFLCHRIPYPPDKGDKIRSYHELAILCRRHRVTLGCMIDDPQDFAHVDALREMCEEVRVERVHHLPALARGGVALMMGRPLSLGYYRSRSFSKWVRDVSHRRAFDAVFAFSSSMGEYGLEAASRGSRVMDLVDLDSQKWRQYAELSSGPKARLYDLEARRMRDWEASLLDSYDHCVVCTGPEMEEMRRHHPHGSIRAIHNGVNLELFPYVEPGDRPPVIAFTGAMDYFPNVDAVGYFAAEILPLVLEQRPDAEFRIIGRNPAPSVRALDDLDRVSVVGAVPDIATELHRAAVAVAPLRVAQGVQNKVLEAMCSGTPVVASAKAFLGIDAAAGDDLVVVDEPAATAAAVVELIGDAGRRVALAARARATIEERYCWERSVAELEQLLRSDG